MFNVPPLIRFSLMVNTLKRDLQVLLLSRNESNSKPGVLNARAALVRGFCFWNRDSLLFASCIPA